jgi:oligoendopeptidase F
VREELKPEISAERFMEIVAGSEAMEKLGYRLYGFAELSFAANTQDQKAQIAVARIQQFAADMSNRTLFFQPVVESSGRRERAASAGSQRRLPLLAGANPQFKPTRSAKPKKR